MRFLLPSGKVHKNYLRYVFYNSSSLFISSLEVSLATDSMLQTVGKDSASTNIAINYLGKDIIGQMLSLGVISQTGKYIDSSPKTFLKYCIVIQQVSVFVECCTPILPIEYFILVGALSNVGKCIAFTGFGGINAKVINELSDGKNHGEIYSKMTMINTITSSVGMGIGLIIGTFIPCHFTRLKILPFLGALRWYFFNKSLQGIL